MKKKSKNLIVLLITIIICVVLSEILLRIFSATSVSGLRNQVVINGESTPVLYNPVEFIETYYQYVEGPGFGHVPSVRIATQWKEHTKGYIIYSTNNLGLREDRNFSKIPPKRTKRFLLLGDSHIDGVCNNDENLSHIAEKIMVSQNVSVEIINAGVGFYGPYQNYLEANRVSQLISIDAIILTVYIGNDYLDLLRQKGRSYLQIINGTFHDVILEESDYIPQAQKEVWKKIIQPIRNFAIFRRLETLLRSQKNDPRVGMIPQIFNQVNIFYHQPEKFEESRLLMEHVLFLFQEWTAEKGFDFLVMILPDVNQIARVSYKSRFEKVENEMGISPQAEDTSINELVRKHLIATANSMNIAYFDLLPLFLGHPNPKKLYWETDLHLSTEGHRMVGSALASELMKRKH